MRQPIDFATTWAEISVGCEACHGQGSAHIAWAKEQQSWWPFGKREDPSKGLLVSFDDRAGVTWLPDPATGNPHRNLPPGLLRKEVETCGLCHARRGEFSEDWVPGRWLSETHAVSPLVPGLYTADGQMLDEVYNYGSFKQSKMFAAGVTCSDCHDPHSAELRLPGDGVCLQCHAAKYESAEHSHHEGGDPPLACSSCHMPVRTYMVVDQRHDHSFRIPRPDLSVKLGTPNACNDCHTDKTAAWAATAVEGWFGPKREGFQHYAEAFHAGWSGGAGAADLLASVAADGNAPAIARASALTALAGQLSPANLPLARGGLRDRDPMVRLGALDMLDGTPLEQRWPLASPLLSNSVQGVRIRAAALLADAPVAQLPAADRERLASATDEFIAAQRLNADRPEGRAALASFYARRGQAAEAEAEYLAALKLSPQYAPAAANLADLYRQLGRESESESILRTALASSPDDAGLHHALGLTLVRMKRLDQALAELRRANELDPASSRYAYVYAVALDSTGRRADAIAALKDNLARHPDDRDTLMGLISFSRDSGDFKGSAHLRRTTRPPRPDRSGPRQADRRAPTARRGIERKLGQPKLPSSRISAEESRSAPRPKRLLGSSSERLAEALNCEPVDLLGRNPLDPEAPWSLSKSLSPQERRQAVEVIKALKRARLAETATEQASLTSQLAPISE